MPVSTAASSAIAAALLPANGSATAGAASADDGLFAALLTGIGQAAGATTQTNTSESGADGAMPVTDSTLLPAAPMPVAESHPNFAEIPSGIAPSMKSAGDQLSTAGAATLLAALPAAPQVPTQAAIQSPPSQPANDDDDTAPANPSAASATVDTASLLPLTPNPDDVNTPVVPPPHRMSTSGAKDPAAKSEPDDSKDGVEPAVGQNNDAPIVLAALAAPIIAPSAATGAASAAGNAISGIGDGKAQPPQTPDTQTASPTAPETEEADVAAPVGQAALNVASAQTKHTAKAAPPPSSGAGKSINAAAAASALAQTQQAKPSADPVQNAAGDVIPAANSAASRPEAAGTLDNMPANTPPSLTVSAPVAAQLSQHDGAPVHFRVDVSPPAPNLASLAVAISTKSQSGARQFDIRLDPPELGRVDVRLSIDAAGKVQAHLSAEHSQTLDLLQKDSGTLTRALRDAGLDVSQNGLNFSLKGQDRHAGSGFSGASHAPARSLVATKAIDTVQSANSYLSSAGDGRLDIHV